MLYMLYIFQNYAVEKYNITNESSTIQEIYKNTSSKMFHVEQILTNNAK
jgi:hypothetical protein